MMSTNASAKQGMMYSHYCKDCNMPDEAILYTLGKQRTVGILCKCQQERAAAIKAEQDERNRLLKQQRLQGSTFANIRLSDYSFKTDNLKDPELTQMAKHYVDNFEKMKLDGKGLLLHGPVGSGKTFIAGCIANALIDKGYACFTISAPQIIAEYSHSSYGNQCIIDEMNKSDLLIIDDLGAERNTDFANEIIFNAINTRYNSKLPLIITTNLSTDSMKNPASAHEDRIFSRIVEMCVPYKVVSQQDQRKEKAANDVLRFREELSSSH